MLNIKSLKIKPIKKGNSDILKLIAIVTMLVDHLGYVFFPEFLILRFIGRLAYPILAYQIYIGFEKTSNFDKYLKRILIFAVISQIPFGLAFDTFELNTIFTFSISLMIIKLLKERKTIPLIIIIAISAIIPMDYGLYGALLPAIFWLFRKDSILTLTATSAWTIGYSLFFVPFYQLFSLVGIFLSLHLRVNIKFKINKWIFYWFYPTHLLIIYFIKLLI